MSTTRGNLSPSKKPKKYKRAGSTTQAEKALVAQFVQDSPQEIQPAQVTALARTLRRSKEAVKAMIDQAKENFVAAGERYTEIHQLAVEQALATGTISGAEVAMKGAQWAMENISAEGSRIIDAVAKGPVGNRIVVGVKIGGLNDVSVGVKSE